MNPTKKKKKKKDIEKTLGKYRIKGIRPKIKRT